MSKACKIIGLIVMLAGGLMILSSLILLIFTSIIDSEASAFCEHVVVELNQEIEQISSEVELEQVLIPSQTQSIEISGEIYVGVLSIPDLGLELPIQEELTYANMKNTPCVYSGSVIFGDLIIGAHNYSSHFGNIYQLKTGSKIYFTDISGVVTEYLVVDSEIVYETEVEYLENHGEWDLTLFTCNVDNTERIIIRCIEI